MARRVPKIKPPAEFLALLEKARKNEAGTPPKKHHLVPSSYLNRWSEDGKIRVTHIDAPRSYVTSPEKAARETDFYRIEAPEIKPSDLPPLLFETMLSDIEGWGKGIIDQLLDSGVNSLNPEQRAQFAWYLAFQLTRGHAFREEQRAITNSMVQLYYQDLTEAGARELLKQRRLPHGRAEVADALAAIQDLKDGKLIVAPHVAAIIGVSGQAAADIGWHLLNRNWYVVETRPLLITCDEPVVRIGGPGFTRAERAGIATARVLVFPLNPSRLLAMFRSDAPYLPASVLDNIETAELNHEILAATSRWAFERPTRHITERMKVPAAPAAVLREGPVPQMSDETREVFRTFSPTRWANCEGDPPPWPVHRWWR